MTAYLKNYFPTSSLSLSSYPTVKLSSLQLLANLGLNPAQIQLISGFIDTYLDLNAIEERIFQEQLASIEPQQEERVMQIVTSWMRQGIQQGMQQGIQQGELTLILRQLNRRLGDVNPQLQERIQGFSTAELEDLGEALLDFTNTSDLEAWLESK
ncbi:MAG: DUF4351 domain-containing protein [Trichormus sp.]